MLCISFSIVIASLFSRSVGGSIYLLVYLTFSHVFWVGFYSLYSLHIGLNVFLRRELFCVAMKSIVRVRVRIHLKYYLNNSTFVSIKLNNKSEMVLKENAASDKENSLNLLLLLFCSAVKRIMCSKIENEEH